MPTSNTLAAKYQKNMKRINTLLFSLMLFGLLFSCSKASLSYTQNGNWVSRAIFAGVPMGNAASFVIGDSAYVGTGYNPNTPNTKLNTVFKYVPDPIPNTPTGYDSASGGWTQVAPFPAAKGRMRAVGFSIGAYGYIGSGTEDGVTPLADFYKYDPSTNSWSAIAPLGDGANTYPRFDAAAFSFDNSAFVLTGTDAQNFFGDVWQYDPGSDKWTQRPNMPGTKRSQAVTWVHNGIGYLVTGYAPGGQWVVGTACYDFWKFDPTQSGNAGWRRLRDIYNTNSDTYDDAYTNIIRYHAAGFVIKGQATGDKGYITTGTNGTASVYTWEYDFATDLWTEKTPYEGAAREGAVGFNIGNRGFIATGVSGSAAYDDCREFFPGQIYNQYD
jgi:N-acetylneuraminic acid mutarotase